MPDLKLVCDNCGSSFALSYEEEEVSYTPSHCPFCGDFYDNTSDELNFNEDEDVDYFGESTEEEDIDDEEESYSKH
jgi:hypothetical protein